MISVRIFESSGTPNDSTINDVDLPSAPQVGDRLEFVEGPGQIAAYKVVGRIFRLRGHGEPGEGMLAVAVKQVTKSEYSWDEVI